MATYNNYSEAIKIFNSQALTFTGAFNPVSVTQWEADMDHWKNIFGPDMKRYFLDGRSETKWTQMDILNKFRPIVQVKNM